MKTHIILLAIALGFVTKGFAQIGTPLTQYSGNQKVYNPGYTGTGDFLALNLSVRQLWVGLPGAPRMISLNGHAPFQNDRHAMGFIFQREEWGPNVGHFGYAGYAHKMFFGENFLSLGIQAGFLNHILDWDQIDHVRDWTDPGLGSGRTQGTHFDVNLGAYFQAPSYYFGFSVKHLAQPKYDFITLPANNGAYPVGENVWYSQKRAQYFFIGGLNLQTYYGYWAWRPEALVRYVHTTPLTVNVGLQAVYLGAYSFKVSYQTGQQAVGFTAAALFGQDFRLGYSYDLYFGRIRGFQRGSHEVSVNYYLRTLWNRRSNINTRTFYHLW